MINWSQVQVVIPPLFEFHHRTGNIHAPCRAIRELEIPDRSSPHCRTLIQRVNGVRLFLHFIYDTTFIGDQIAYIIESGDQGVDLDGLDIEKLRSLGKATRTDRLRESSQTQFEMVISRVIDDFSVFLTQMIESAIAKRPEVLRSSEQISLEAILQHETMDNLVVHLVECKVNELGYLRFENLND